MNNLELQLLVNQVANDDRLLLYKYDVMSSPNVWSRRTVIEAWVHLGRLHDQSSADLPEFRRKLHRWLPGLREHRCSVGEPGGFLRRLEQGTYPAHIFEHVWLELQSLCGTQVGYGRTRPTFLKHVDRIIVAYVDERTAQLTFALTRLLLLTAYDGKDLPVEILQQVLQIIRVENLTPPVVNQLVQNARNTGIPVVRPLNDKPLYQLGYGKYQQRITWPRKTPGQDSFITLKQILLRSISTTTDKTINQARRVYEPQQRQPTITAHVSNPEIRNHIANRTGKTIFQPVLPKDRPIQMPSWVVDQIVDHLTKAPKKQSSDIMANVINCRQRTYDRFRAHSRSRKQIGNYIPLLSTLVVLSESTTNKIDDQLFRVLLSLGKKPALATATYYRIGTSTRSHNQDHLFRHSRAAVLHATIDSIIITTTPRTVLQEGLPINYINIAVVLDDDSFIDDTQEQEDREKKDKWRHAVSVVKDVLTDDSLEVSFEADTWRVS